MRAEEPFTSVEIKERARHFENLIARLKKAFPHKHHSEVSNLPEIVLLEHDKFVIENIVKKLSDDLTHIELSKLTDFIKNFSSDIDNDVVNPSEVYDIDEFLKEKAHKSDAYTEEDLDTDTSEVFDTEDYLNHENLTKEFSNPSISKLRDELKTLHNKVDLKIKNKLKN